MRQAQKLLSLALVIFGSLHKSCFVEQNSRQNKVFENIESNNVLLTFNYGVRLALSSCTMKVRRKFSIVATLCASFHAAETNTNTR